MSDRIQYIDGARLTEAMLNDSFGFLEQADHHLVADVGILHGLAPQARASAPDMSLTITPGLAYDHAGRRICVDVAQTVDCSRSAAGIPMARGMTEHERWLSVCMAFARRDSDPVLDHYGRTVAMRQMETFSTNATQIARKY